MAEAMTVPQGQYDAATLRSWLVDSWRPSRTEERYEITEVYGTIPRELNGTLYRNGPSQNILPTGGYEALHLFDGDGLVHAFRFDDGRAHYTGRFVRDECFLIEQEEGRYCANGVNVKVDDPSDRIPLRVQHNTNVVHHGGRLLALVENGVPFEIDPRSLDPIGTFDLDGRMLGWATSAHPKIDPVNGQMLIHGYQPVSPFVQYYVIEADGACSLAEPVEAPYPVMMHDLAITARHVIFPLCPVVIEPDIIFGGGTFAESIRWAPERGMGFGVRARHAGAETRWFEAPTPGFFFHFGNAYEVDDKIVVDACVYPDPVGLLEALRTFRRGDIGPGIAALPFLYELDLGRSTCIERQLDDRPAEFPRCDDRLVGRPNRYGYAVVGRDHATSPHDAAFGAIVKYDRTGGRSVYHHFDRGSFASEPIFVPRHPDAAEDDGFVLSVVYEGPSGRSHVVILDAQNLEREPLARLYLHHRIPMGFHGSFAPGIV